MHHVLIPDDNHSSIEATKLKVSVQVATLVESARTTLHDVQVRIMATRVTTDHETIDVLGKKIVEDLLRPRVRIKTSKHHKIGTAEDHAEHTMTEEMRRYPEDLTTSEVLLKTPIRGREDTRMFLHHLIMPSADEVDVRIVPYRLTGIECFDA